MSNFRLEYLQYENEKKLHARKMELLEKRGEMTEKAEIRFIDNDYYVTQGDKKVLVAKLIDNDLIDAHMPDGRIVKISNLTGETLFKASCFLTNLTLSEELPLTEP